MAQHTHHMFNGQCARWCYGCREERDERARAASRTIADVLADFHLMGDAIDAARTSAWTPYPPPREGTAVPAGAS